MTCLCMNSAVNLTLNCSKLCDSSRKKAENEFLHSRYSRQYSRTDKNMSIQLPVAYPHIDYYSLRFVN
jgi:hypothetical protein